MNREFFVPGIPTIDYLPDNQGRFKFLITCKNEQDIIDIFHMLVNPEQGDGSLRQSVECYDYRYDDNYSCVFLLTEEQKNELLKDSRIIQIENYPLSEASTCIVQNLCADRLDTANDGNDDNYALSRCMELTAGSNYPNIYNYTFTGSGVDVVIVDSGIDANHPEWNSRTTGQSRLQRINWTLFYSLTSNTSQTVTVAGGLPYLNSQLKPTILTWNNSRLRNGNNTTGIGTPLVYSFDVNALNSTNTLFVISQSIYGTPLSSSKGFITNNASKTGIISLTAQYLTNDPIPSTLYYYLSTEGGSYVNNSYGIISRTNYNTQNLQFYSDFNGHGTHCTGTVAGSSFGWAKEADIYHITSIDVNNGFNVSENWGLDLLLEWHKWKLTQPSLSSRPTVASNSYRRLAYGGINYSTVYASNVYYPITLSINSVVREMILSGVHFVRAAGNENVRLVPYGHWLFNVGLVSGQDYSYRPGTPGWTYDEPQGPIIFVGATDNILYVPGQETKAYFSDKGPFITVYAPGVNIQSTWPNTSYATYRNGAFGSFGTRKIGGTSMACPQVAGFIATVLEKYPKMTPQQMKDYLQANAVMGSLEDDNTLYSGYTQYDLASGVNLFLYQFPGKQYFFNDKNSGNINLGTNNYNLSGSIASNISPLSGLLMQTYSHTFSALSASLASFT